MLRTCLLFFIIATIISILCAGETNQESILKKKLEQVKKIPQKVEPVQPIGPLPEVIAKPIVWIIKNTVKPDGWSLTGYASLKIDRDNNINRWKIGIINPELDAHLYNQEQWRDFERWQDRVNRRESGVVFGIIFTRTF